MTAELTVSHSLLAEVLDAHGGLERARAFTRVAADVVSGGFLWAMKGIPLDVTPRRMTSGLRRPWTRTEPFGHADWHMTYSPDRVAIMTSAGDVVAEQENPRETFIGHTWETEWTPLQLAYFNGYAMWTYYNFPFLLGEPGIETAEIPSISHEGSILRGLRVRLPPHLHSHSAEQSLYFDGDRLLRRHDYEVAVAGNAPAAHLISDYISVQGLMLPTQRRVFMRNPDGTLQFDRMPVSIDLSNFELS